MEWILGIAIALFVGSIVKLGIAHEKRKLKRAWQAEQIKIMKEEIEEGRTKDALSRAEDLEHSLKDTTTVYRPHE